MATYITVEANDKRVWIVFNDLEDHQDVNAFNASFKRASLVKIWHYKNPECVVLTMSTGDVFELNLTGADGYWPVSTIDIGDGNGAITPADVEEMHTLLDSLIL